jgi:hypothetical protein
MCRRRGLCDLHPIWFLCLLNGSRDLLPKPTQAPVFSRFFSFGDSNFFDAPDFLHILFRLLLIFSKKLRCLSI